MRFPWLFLFGVVLAPVGAGAVCPTTPTDCPTPQYKGLTVTPDASSVAALAASGAVTGAGFVSRFATPGPIGNGTPSTGAFTTLNATGAVSGAGITALFASPPPVGGTAAAAGAFTTLSTSGAVSGTGFVNRFASPGPIGNTAASTGAFTTLSATSGGTFTGTIAGNPTFSGNVNFSGKLTGKSITWLNAVDYGVVADGVTSDDAALKAAVDACSAAGTTLLLPPGQILLTGAAGSIMIKNCAIRGVGIPAGVTSNASKGTMILLTSTSVVPFNFERNWSLYGVNFYWPNQTGAGATFTATGAGTNLTVTSVSAVNGGTIVPGYLLVGTGVPLNTTIVSQSSGTTGGAGVYVTSNATISSGAALNVARPLTVYPPLMLSLGDAEHFVIDNVTVVNAYDFMSSTAPFGWGDFYITNSNLYAVHNLITSPYIGDTFYMGPNHFTPGPWLAMTSFAPGTLSALNWAAQNNTMFYAAGSPFQLVAAGIAAESWRYGIRLAVGTTMSQSIFQIAGDSVATLLEVPAGATYAGFNNFITGSVGCNVANWIAPNAQYGAPTCFNISDTSTLLLSSFTGGSRGDFIRTNGGSVKLVGLLASAGGNSDGTDYYAVNLTANVGSLVVQDSSFQGVACSESALGCVHAHGINTGAFKGTYVQVQNNRFSYFQDVLTMTPEIPSGSTIVTGNQSFGTNGTVGVTFAGTGLVTWGNNAFDKPPLAAVSACGAGATLSGTTSGTIQVGSTNPTTSCTLTLPFALLGGASCFVSPNGFGVTLNASTSAFVATIGSSADMHGGAIFYNCPGQQ